MENSKKGNLPLHHGIKISKDLCPKTDEELDQKSRVPYALAIGSIHDVNEYTRLDVSFCLVEAMVTSISKILAKKSKGHVIVKDIRSEDNLADLFIKALAKSRHDEHARSIGLKDKIKF
ncbi:hypothetical protein Tco_0209022 [Tanacetum coccineum]